MVRDGAAFCSTCGAARARQVELGLAIDRTTLKHLAVHERGLVRLRIENRGTEAVPVVALAASLSGEALPIVATAGELGPGAHVVLAIATVPTLAGYHPLAGE